MCWGGLFEMGVDSLDEDGLGLGGEEQMSASTWHPTIEKELACLDIFVA